MWKGKREHQSQWRLGISVIERTRMHAVNQVAHRNGPMKWLVGCWRCFSILIISSIANWRRRQVRVSTQHVSSANTWAATPVAEKVAVVEKKTVAVNAFYTFDRNVTFLCKLNDALKNEVLPLASLWLLLLLTDKVRSVKVMVADGRLSSEQGRKSEHSSYLVLLTALLRTGQRKESRL